ncbi:hypothetical protein AB205_0008170, partial [Aquarana catesbeiana]
VPSQWTSVLPEHWSKDHVCEWLQYCCDNYKLDATCIPFPQFNVTGHQLCSMTKEDFTEAAGACGHYLYSLLQDIRTHGLHNPHLWEFIRDLLLSPEDNHGTLDWEDQEQGIFRVVKSEALAQLWGQRKRNNRMNYEKLSRAMRHYYKTGILERVDRRLVYKFGKNAYGWH